MSSSDAAPSALVVDNVTKRFGNVLALDDVSFSLGATELLALVGPSGCGKSTLLRTIAGLVRADHGRLRLGGLVVDDGTRHVPPEHRRIGLVFQDHALFPHLRVAENIAFGVRDASRRDTNGRVAEMLEVVDLVGYGERFPHELSGGERQRVALARALAPRPALMLLDEPFASLDSNLRSQLRASVTAALEITGTPGVFVTHDQEEALATGDRIAVMRSGRIEQLADPVSVYHSPANSFVARFMGEVNLLPITSDAGGARTLLGPVDTTDVGRDVSSEMQAMLRPDDVTFTESAVGGACIVGAEFRGTTWGYRIELPGGIQVLASGSHLHPFSVGMRGEVTLTPGHWQVLVPIT